MTGKKIIFLDSGDSLSFKKVATRALISTGSQVEIETAFSEFTKKVQTSSFDLAILSYDQNDAEFASKVDDLFQVAKDIPIVIFSERRDKEHLTELFSNNNLRNLIARNDQISEEEVIVTVEKLLKKDIFGMEKYFTWGVDFKNYEVSDSHKKEALVSEVARFAESLKCDKRYIKHAEVIADEMIMNALYDAPVDEEKNHLYAHLPRTERVVLKDRKAELSFGSNGKYLGISCKDPFGALNGQTVVSYLRKCFANDESQIDSKPGGAGVGLYMIFQYISQLVVNISENKCTEIIGLIDIRTSYKESKRKTKSLNIFIEQNDQE